MYIFSLTHSLSLFHSLSIFLIFAVRLRIAKHFTEIAQLSYIIMELSVSILSFASVNQWTLMTDTQQYSTNL